MEQVRAVIFDFDFTLADSSRGVFECINSGLKSIGLKPVTYDEVCKTIGLSLPETLVALKGEEARELSQRFHMHFLRKADKVMVDLTKVYPETSGTLQYLKGRGYLVGIASTKYRYRIESILKRDGLLDFFKAIIGGEDVSEHKPNPECLEKAAVKLGVDLSYCVYIGDNRVDGEAAMRAGVPFIASLTGFTSLEDLKAYDPIAVIEDLSQLNQVL
jgi:phosphoglycolate phosphatase